MEQEKLRIYWEEICAAAVQSVITVLWLRDTEEALCWQADGSSYATIRVYSLSAGNNWSTYN